MKKISIEFPENNADSHQYRCLFNFKQGLTKQEGNGPLGPAAYYD